MLLEFYPGFCSSICSFNVRAVICIIESQNRQYKSNTMGKKYHGPVDDDKKRRWSIHYSLWLIICNNIFAFAFIKAIFKALIVVPGSPLLIHSLFSVDSVLSRFWKSLFYLKVFHRQMIKKENRWKKNFKFALWKQCNVFR